MAIIKKAEQTTFDWSLVVARVGQSHHHNKVVVAVLIKIAELQSLGICSVQVVADLRCESTGPGIHEDPDPPRLIETAWNDRVADHEVGPSITIEVADGEAVAGGLTRSA